MCKQSFCWRFNSGSVFSSFCVCGSTAIYSPNGGNRFICLEQRGHLREGSVNTPNQKQFAYNHSSPVFAVNVELSASSGFCNLIIADSVHTESCVNRNLFLQLSSTDATSLFLVSCLLRPLRQDFRSQTKSLDLRFLCEPPAL